MASAATLRKKAAAERAKADMYRSMQHKENLVRDLEKTEQEILKCRADSAYTSPGEVFGGIVTTITVVCALVWFFAG